jgi:signal transduction histidine kinase
MQTYLYRIVQEALSNVIKYAQSSEVNVQLLGNADQVTLLIQDDGKGFDVSELPKSKGNGLNNIRERVTILNGSLEIFSHPGEGTSINVKIPLS